MIKDLKKQIEDQKNSLTQPLKKQVEEVLKGFDVKVLLDDEFQEVAVISTMVNGPQIVKLNFILSEQEETFSSEGFEYTISEQGTVSGIKSIPVSIGAQVINYIMQLMMNLLIGLNKEPETEVDEEVVEAEK